MERSRLWLSPGDVRRSAAPPNEPNTPRLNTSKTASSGRSGQLSGARFPARQRSRTARFLEATNQSSPITADRQSKPSKDELDLQKLKRANLMVRLAKKGKGDSDTAPKRWIGSEANLTSRLNSSSARNVGASLEADSRLRYTVKQLHYNKTKELRALAAKENPKLGSSSLEEMSSLIPGPQPERFSNRWEGAVPIMEVPFVQAAPDIVVSATRAPDNPVEYLNEHNNGGRPIGADLLLAADETQLRHQHLLPGNHEPDWGHRKMVTLKGNSSALSSTLQLPHSNYDDIITWTPAAGPVAYRAGVGPQLGTYFQARLWPNASSSSLIDSSFPAELLHAPGRDEPLPLVPGSRPMASEEPYSSVPDYQANESRENPVRGLRPPSSMELPANIKSSSQPPKQQQQQQQQPPQTAKQNFVDQKQQRKLEEAAAAVSRSRTAPAHSSGTKLANSVQSNDQDDSSDGEDENDESSDDQQEGSGVINEEEPAKSGQKDAYSAAKSFPEKAIRKDKINWPAGSSLSMVDQTTISRAPKRHLGGWTPSTPGNVMQLSESGQAKQSADHSAHWRPERPDWRLKDGQVQPSEQPKTSLRLSQLAASPRQPQLMLANSPALLGPNQLTPGSQPEASGLWSLRAWPMLGPSSLYTVLPGASSSHLSSAKQASAAKPLAGTHSMLAPDLSVQLQQRHTGSASRETGPPGPLVWLPAGLLAGRIRSQTQLQPMSLQLQRAPLPSQLATGPVRQLSTNGHAFAHERGPPMALLAAGSAFLSSGPSYAPLESAGLGSLMAVSAAMPVTSFSAPPSEPASRPGGTGAPHLAGAVRKPQATSVIGATLPVAAPSSLPDPFGWPAAYGSSAAHTLLQVNHVAPPPAFLLPGRPLPETLLAPSGSAALQAAASEPAPYEQLLASHELGQPVWPAGRAPSAGQTQPGRAPPGRPAPTSRRPSLWQRLRRLRTGARAPHHRASQPKVSDLSDGRRHKRAARAKGQTLSSGFIPIIGWPAAWQGLQSDLLDRAELGLQSSLVASYAQPSSSLGQLGQLTRPTGEPVSYPASAGQAQLITGSLEPPANEPRRPHSGPTLAHLSRSFIQRPIKGLIRIAQRPSNSSAQLLPRQTAQPGGQKEAQLQEAAMNQLALDELLDGQIMGPAGMETSLEPIVLQAWLAQLSPEPVSLGAPAKARQAASVQPMAANPTSQLMIQTDPTLLQMQRQALLMAAQLPASQTSSLSAANFGLVSGPSAAPLHGQSLALRRSNGARLFGLSRRRPALAPTPRSGRAPRGWPAAVDARAHHREMLAAAAMRLLGAPAPNNLTMAASQQRLAQVSNPLGPDADSDPLEPTTAAGMQALPEMPESLGLSSAPTTGLDELSALPELQSILPSHFEQTKAGVESIPLLPPGSSGLSNPEFSLDQQRQYQQQLQQQQQLVVHSSPATSSSAAPISGVLQQESLAMVNRPRLPKLIPSINSMASRFRQHLIHTFRLSPARWPMLTGGGFMSSALPVRANQLMPASGSGSGAMLSMGYMGQQAGPQTQPVLQAQPSQQQQQQQSLMSSGTQPSPVQPQTSTQQPQQQQVQQQQQQQQMQPLQSQPQQQQIQLSQAQQPTTATQQQQQQQSNFYNLPDTVRQPHMQQQQQQQQQMQLQAPLQVPIQLAQRPIASQENRFHSQLLQQPSQFSQETSAAQLKDVSVDQTGPSGASLVGYENQLVYTDREQLNANGTSLSLEELSAGGGEPTFVGSENELLGSELVQALGAGAGQQDQFADGSSPGEPRQPDGRGQNGLPASQADMSEVNGSLMSSDGTYIASDELGAPPSADSPLAGHSVVRGAHAKSGYRQNHHHVMMAHTNELADPSGPQLIRPYRLVTVEPNVMNMSSALSSEASLESSLESEPFDQSGKARRIQKQVSQAAGFRVNRPSAQQMDYQVIKAVHRLTAMNASQLSAHEAQIAQQRLPPPTSEQPGEQVQQIEQEQQQQQQVLYESEPQHQMIVYEQQMVDQVSQAHQLQQPAEPAGPRQSGSQGELGELVVYRPAAEQAGSANELSGQPEELAGSNQTQQVQQRPQTQQKVEKPAEAGAQPEAESAGVQDELGVADTGNGDQVGGGQQSGDQSRLVFMAGRPERLAQQQQQQQQQQRVAASRRRLQLKAPKSAQSRPHWPVQQQSEQQQAPPTEPPVAAAHANQLAPSGSSAAPSGGRQSSRAGASSTPAPSSPLALLARDSSTRAPKARIRWQGMSGQVSRQAGPAPSNRSQVEGAAGVRPEQSWVMGGSAAASEPAASTSPANGVSSGPQNGTVNQIQVDSSNNGSANNSSYLTPFAEPRVASKSLSGARKDSRTGSTSFRLSSGAPAGPGTPTSTKMAPPNERPTVFSGAELAPARNETQLGPNMGATGNSSHSGKQPMEPSQLQSQHQQNLSNHRAQQHQLDRNQPVQVPNLGSGGELGGTGNELELAAQTASQARPLRHSETIELTGKSKGGVVGAGESLALPDGREELADDSLVAQLQLGRRAHQLATGFNSMGSTNQLPDKPETISLSDEFHARD